MENRVSKEQVLFLLDHLQTHKELARGQGLGVRSKETIDKLWEDLALKLNSFGSGASKSGYRWKRYWADLKCKAKARAVAVKKEYRATGGGPNIHGALSEVDDKVLNIIGLSAVHGDTQYCIPVFGPPLSTEKDSSKENDMPEAVKAETSESMLDETTGTFLLHNSPSAKSATPTITSPIEQPYSPRGLRQTTPRRVRRPLRPRNQTLGSNQWVVELEQRRIAAEEKMAEAAHIMAKAALIQAETHRELINILKEKI